MASGWRESYQQERGSRSPTTSTSRPPVPPPPRRARLVRGVRGREKLNSEQAMRLADVAVSALEEESFSAGPSGLTAREIDVLHLVADGLSNAEIAERLVLVIVLCTPICDQSSTSSA